jgi:hypothetical protein
MKKLTMVLAIVTMSILLIGSAFAQTSVTENLNLTVGTIYKMSTTYVAPIALSIGAAQATAGTDALTAVTDASTSYSITQNAGAAVKITAKLDIALPAVPVNGFTLTVNLASAKGASQGAVNISDATAKDVVTGIAMGADAAKTITYSFAALASAGTLSATKTVTLTLTN